MPDQEARHYPRFFFFFLRRIIEDGRSIYRVNIREKHPFPHTVPFPSQIIRFFTFFFIIFFFFIHIFFFFFFFILLVKTLPLGFAWEIFDLTCKKRNLWRHLASLRIRDEQKIIISTFLLSWHVSHASHATLIFLISNKH